MEPGIKSIFLAGIGSLAYTYEKSMALVEELVKKGELTVSQGKELNEELKRKIKKEDGMAQEERYTIRQLKDMLAELNLATKEDIRQLNDRISKLENP